MPELFDFKVFEQRPIEFATRRRHLRSEQNGEIAEKK
jgi:hypothetical protein